MRQLKAAYIVLFVIVYYFKTEAADKYIDQNRPYEFGFTIDGEQHRHEKKDENGIIMGEFGFITADGVYHVTVYATDENGNFKILSMKNIRVKPYPTAPGVSERQGHSLQLPQSQQQSTSQFSAQTQQSQQQSKSHVSAKTQLSQQQSTSHISAKTQQSQQQSTSQTSANTQQSQQRIQLVQERKASASACSHCSIPTTTTASPKEAGLAIVSKIGSSQNSDKQSQLSERQSYNNLGQSYQQNVVPSQSLQQPLGSDYNYPNQPVNTNNQQQYSQQTPSQENFLQNNTQTNNQEDFNVGRKYLQRPRLEQNYQTKASFEPNAVQATDYPQQGQNQIVTINANDQTYARDNKNQNNLREPTLIQKNQEISYPGQSYSQTPGAYKEEPLNNYKRTNYPVKHNIQQNSAQSYPEANNNKYAPEDQNKYSRIQDKPLLQQNSLLADRQPKTFKAILHSVSPKEYKLTNTGTNLPGSTLNTGNEEKPILIAAQMQIVDKNTDVHHKDIGETDGLPKGLTKGDMQQLLYTFNYTLGFHGHHEEGYTNGAKIGYYYVTGRNGIRTRVDYVADETGFHPRISQEVLDKQSEDVPKPETEKDEKYGLKGYEFKWLYYPVNSK